MEQVYIVDAVRTPMGRFKGGLSSFNSVDLGAQMLNALAQRNDLDTATVDDVIFGCINQIGAQSANLARNSLLAAGWPDTVPGVTIDRQCGSSQQALHFAAQGIQAGAYDIAVAGGVEVMSLVPLNSGFEFGPKMGVGHPFEAEGWVARYGSDKVHQFASGERIADKWNIEREEMERLALASHQRADRAWNEGRFDSQVIRVNDLERDETIRATTSMEKMAQLQPISEGGRITAGTASQLADAASGVLLASESALKANGWVPMARVHTMAVVGSDPWLMLTGPIPATAKVLDRAKLTLDDMDLIEINEAFASVVLAWQRETGADLEKTNVNGGAMALGHALGATGTRIAATLVHELRRQSARYGLMTICEGGGLANATILEAL